ncbi:MAG: AIM24 family protein [Acidiferrobacter sp.]
MPEPVLKKTLVRDESFAGVTYHIEGEMVPVLQIILDTTPIFFEHHVLLWKSPSTRIGVKAVKGLLRRAISGMPILLASATGPGTVAFSRDGAGQVVPIHLAPGQAIDVREHQYLAATDQVAYSIARIKGIMNWVFGGNTLIVDQFRADMAPGIVWLHGFGNVFEVTLGAGESIDLEPGGWLYKDPSVAIKTVTQSLSSGLFGSAASFFWNRFTGPGRVGIQSMYVPTLAVET